MKAYLAAAVLMVALVLGSSLYMGAGVLDLFGAGETQRALFIGNSYTSSNDLPGMVANVLGENGVDLEFEVMAPGGRTLEQHAADPAVRAAMANGRFDIVILQDQSETPAVPHLLADNSIPAAEALGAMATESGARVILFETWGHRNGSPHTGHTSFDSMQSALTSAYWLLADAAGGTIAPVGSTWARSLGTNDVVLHHSDGSHPSPAGTHLASLVIARSIIGDSLASFPSNGIPGDEADQLAALLW